MSLFITLIILIHAALFVLLAFFALHRYLLVRRYYQNIDGLLRDRVDAMDGGAEALPCVLVQLPLYNERYMAEEALRSLARLDYPRHKLQIQVLDDSTDDTSRLVARVVRELITRGLNVQHIKRDKRIGYKAGALADGLRKFTSDLVAVFDADFRPSPDFLQRTVGHFVDPEVGLVQTRWTHSNPKTNTLTRLQSLMLDGHFIIEHGARFLSGCWFNFNGTAGVWRRSTIDAAGGWSQDTLTEDLDLSYRAQLAGWRFIYRPDIECASALPESMLGFKSQQRRWTTGSIQTSVKLLPEIWRSTSASHPWRKKVEATIHLLSNTSWVLLLLWGLMLGPVYEIRHRYGLPELFWMDATMLLMGVGSLWLFYANARRELGESPWSVLYQIPLLIALGMGMAMSNSVAAVRGCFVRGGEFFRTPKLTRRNAAGSLAKSEPEPNISYQARLGAGLLMAELVLILYFGAIVIVAVQRGTFGAIPFPLIFLLGGGWVSGSGWIERLRCNKMKAPASSVSDLVVEN